MSRRIIFTEEERQQDRVDVLKLLKVMPSYAEIATELGRSKSYITAVKDYLVDAGLITEEEIEEFRRSVKEAEQKKLDEKVLELLKRGLTESAIKRELKRDIRTIQDSIERLIKADPSVAKIQTSEEAKRKEIKAKIVKAVQNEQYVSDIIRNLSLSTHAFNMYIDDLVKKGKIRREDLKYKSADIAVERKRRNKKIYKMLDEKVPHKVIASKFGLQESTIKSIAKSRNNPRKCKKLNKRKIDVIEPNPEILTEMEIEIIELVKDGFSYHYISKMYYIEMSDLMNMLKEFKRQKFLTQDLINEAQNERRCMYLNGILSLLKDGVMQKDIYNILNSGVEDISQSKISRMTDELIDMGLITREEILYAQGTSEHGRMTVDEKVLGYLKKGIALCDMHSHDEFITLRRACNSASNLVKEGKITNEEIEQQRKRREKRALYKTHSKDRDRAWEYIEEYGATNKEIATSLGVSKTYVLMLIKGIKRRKKLSDEEFEALRLEKRKSYKEKLQKYRDSITELQNRYDILEKYFLRAKERFERYTDLPTPEMQINYFNAFKALDSLGKQFDETEIKILCYCVLYEPSISNKENVEFAIRKCMETKNHKQANALLRDFIEMNPMIEDISHFREHMYNIIGKLMMNTNAVQIINIYLGQSPKEKSIHLNT